MRMTVASAGEEFFERRGCQVVETEVPVRLGLQSRESFVMQDVRRDWVGRVVGRWRHIGPAGSCEGSRCTRPRVIQKLAHSEWLEELCNKGFARRAHKCGRTWHPGLS